MSCVKNLITASRNFILNLIQGKLTPERERARSNVKNAKFGNRNKNILPLYISFVLSACICLSAALITLLRFTYSEACEINETRQLIL